MLVVLVVDLLNLVGGLLFGEWVLVVIGNCLFY